MKRILTVLALWGLVLSLSTAGILYLGRLKEELTGLIDSAAVSQSRAETVSLAGQIEERWNKGGRLLRIFMRHNEADEVEKISSGLKALAENGETGELRGELARMKDLLRHIYQSELPALNSIF